MIVDTSGIIAALFDDQPQYAECSAALEAAERPALLSPFVLAEADYLITRRGGVDLALGLLDDVASGAYELASFTAAQVARCRLIAARYRDLEVGLTDASIVVLAQDRGITDLLTLDHRHFRVLARETPLLLLPADLPRRRPR